MTPAQILALLPLLISTGEEVYSLVKKLLATLQQSAELTPEEEQARDTLIESLNLTDWWQPDPPPAAAGKKKR